MTARKRAAIGGALALSLMAGAAGTAFAQDNADAAAEEYARVLKQISDTKINIARQELMVEAQARDIATLDSQIEQVPATLTAYTPVVAKFAATIENVIDTDVPFRRGERFDRLSAFQEVVADKERSLGEKVARALQVANIETTYGYELESYDANHPTDAGRRYKACSADVDSAACGLTEELREDMAGGRSVPQMELELTDGSYIRYGRLSLAYVDLGTDEVLVWDGAANDWREARGSEEAGILRNLRIARGESAPDVVQAPVVKTN